MAPVPRLIVPGMPHHVTQRGSRRGATFFCGPDCELYLDLARQVFGRYGIEVWAWCLMPNHVHFVLVPPDEEALWKAMACLNRTYAKLLNQRNDWTGAFWQGPFRSYLIADETYLLRTVRYIELNPVAAGLVAHPALWDWSSARAHLSLADDRLVRVAPLLERWPYWREVLASALTSEERFGVEQHLGSGLPSGTPAAIDALGARLGRVLHARAPGRPSNKM